MKPRLPKACGKGAGFTWRRDVAADVVKWTMFRRDRRNVLRQVDLELGFSTDTCVAAHLLRLRRRQLRVLAGLKKA